MAPDQPAPLAEQTATDQSRWDKVQELRMVRLVPRGKIAVIQLNRPDRLNSFTPRMASELVFCLDLIDSDDRLRVAIVTGNGRAFCAGADLGAGATTFKASAVSERHQQASAHGDAAWLPLPPAPVDGVPRDLGGWLALRIFANRKPVIAAINGPAAGVGATMTLPMDIRLCATSSRFVFPFAARGIVPEACSSWFLPRIVGVNRAIEWNLLGEPVDAGEALASGLVRSVHEPDALIGAATELAERIAARAAPVSSVLTRSLMWSMLTVQHPLHAHEVESRTVPYCGSLDDAREGITSFLEKRDPSWTGRASTDLPAFYPWLDEPPFQ